MPLPLAVALPARTSERQCSNPPPSPAGLPAGRHLKAAQRPFATSRRLPRSAYRVLLLLRVGSINQSGH